MTTNNCLKNCTHIIAVASGKGGVGKSTVALRLALELQARGKSVGVVDADIYGPSIPQMLGGSYGKAPEIKNNLMQPVILQGLYTNSLGYLVDEQTPAIWRGPIASKALEQLLLQTNWPKLDYLIIDLPPGTGDTFLTLIKKVSILGVILVTTPQKVAELDAVKSGNMFKKLKVPILGVVENMSSYICGHCQGQNSLFGNYPGGKNLAATLGTELLASIPLLEDLCVKLDNGKASDTLNDLILKNIFTAICYQIEQQLPTQITTNVVLQTDA